MKGCNNPYCKRKVEHGIMYCCALCAICHEKGYTPTHTSSCDERNGINREPSPTEGLEVALWFESKKDDLTT